MDVSDNLWKRFFFLALLIFIINVWCMYHLGDYSWKLAAANGPILLIAVVKFLSKVFTKKESEKLSVIFRGWARFWLKLPVLIVLFFLFFVLSTLVSSVTIMSSGLSERVKVHLFSEGKTARVSVKTLEGPNDIERFIRFTSPFGRSFYLDVEGYQRYSFDLFPWLGKRVRIKEDLNVTPSLLLRIPTGVGMHLPRGRVVVYADSEEIATGKTSTKNGALLVGRNVPIPSSFVERWKLELVAMGITSQEAAATSLLIWQNPAVTKPSAPIIPGSILVVKFLTHQGKVKARARFAVGTEKIQDILMSIEEEKP